jgi:putative flippase GtrA
LRRLPSRLSSAPEGRKQLVKFGFIGGLAVLTDLAFYYLFLQLLPEALLPPPWSNEAVAKTFSFLCGLMVTYHFNKRWTWRRRDRSRRRLIKFLALYGMSMVLNVSLNSLFLWVLHQHGTWSWVPRKYVIAFMGATGICAVFNFVGQKFWIFPAGPLDGDKDQDATLAW